MKMKFNVLNMKNKKMAAQQNPAESPAANEGKPESGAARPEAENGAEQEPGKEEVSAREQELEAELAKSGDKYLRLAAEYDNYRRRVAKERLELIGTACEDVIKGLLPVLDDCERALAALAGSSDSQAAKEGTELIYNKLMTYLKSKGLERIQAKDQEFDTDFHEAVAQFPVEEPERKNRIIDVVQQGYTLSGKVIRYAKVVVGV